MSAQVTAIEIVVAGTTLRLTLDEARALRDQLNLVVQKEPEPPWKWTWPYTYPQKISTIYQTPPVTVTGTTAIPFGEVVCDGVN